MESYWGSHSVIRSWICSPKSIKSFSKQMKWDNPKSAPCGDKSWIATQINVQKNEYEKKTIPQRKNRNSMADGRKIEYKTVPDGKELWVNTRWKESAKHADPNSNTSSPERQIWMRITGFVLSLFTHPHVTPSHFSMEH